MEKNPYSNAVNVSLEDPRLNEYRNLKVPKNDSQVFIAENEKVVQRLIESNLPLKSILGTKESIERNCEFFLRQNIDPSFILQISEENLEQLVGFKIHRNLLAESYIPKSLSIEQLGSEIICLNRVHDAENIGSILRSSVALGIQSFAYDQYTSSPYSRRSVRVSMGNVFNMKIAKIDSIERSIDLWKQNGYRILGTSLQTDAKTSIPIWDFPFPDKWVLILGNEAFGMDQNVLDLCDQLINIPMDNSVDSLNIAHSLTSILSISKFQNRMKHPR
ncbi:TrmH family RNA methyltransferase [Leptospira sp. GIMC2001]|uniref:TrmH family RNA methyltransferase n=1 Tax=Leptospira sp. GIMC2001 TaxID=1513297 RepID=UPI0023490F76|nr:RNA methyltransferase [Leptospira sp. GIMC2001]WCL50209.1 RNA methyltransferase [Leptospira sp. GIMC2001]